MDKEDRYMEFVESIHSIYRNTEIVTFLDQLSYKDFYNNLTSIDRTYYYGADGEVFLAAGCKVLKAFKYFEDNPNIVKDIQQKASMLIQENCITGTICFSIHPLDYLSISENALNWRSCHSLDGDYRAGNLQYMLDNSTVICYLKAKKNAVLPNFPEDVLWNNKKWRMLLFFDNDMNMVFAGRQYPFESKIALDTVLHLMTEAGFGLWSQWNNSYLTKMGKPPFYFDKCLPIGEGLSPIYSLIKSPSIKLYFNDLLDSHIYKNPYYSYNVTSSNPFSQTGWTRIDKTKFYIGRNAKCLRCGKHYISYPDLCHCDYCNNEDEQKGYLTCDCCGRNIPVEESYKVEDYYICDQCFKTQTAICERCGEVVFKDHILYNEINNTYICQNCVEEMKN